MSKVKGKRVVRRSKRRKTVTAPPASLPPQVPGVDAAAPVTAVAVKKAFWDVGKDSGIYEQAMRILALRATGIDDKAIADTMSLSLQTIHNYCYIAGKNGWAQTFGNAKDQIEFGIMPKVVRELEAGLDDHARHQTSGMRVSTQVALQIADGTLFKKFEQASDGRPISNVIAIRIENVGAPIVETVRTSSGTPAYAEGEVVDESVAE